MKYKDSPIRMIYLLDIHPKSNFLEYSLCCINHIGYGLRSNNDTRRSVCYTEQ